MTAYADWPFECPNCSRTVFPDLDLCESDDGPLCVTKCCPDEHGAECAA